MGSTNVDFGAFAVPLPDLHGSDNKQQAAAQMQDAFLQTFKDNESALPKLPAATSQELAFEACLQEGSCKARTTAYVAFGKECVKGTQLYDGYKNAQTTWRETSSA